MTSNQTGAALGRLLEKRARLVAARYDDQGDKEWERVARSPVDAESLFIQTHYLQEFVRSGGPDKKPGDRRRQTRRGIRWKKKPGLD